jgi:hypothetical protein
VIDRRDFVLGLAAGALLAVAPSRRIWAAADPVLGAATRTALEESPYVYVSPLKSDGQESRCHAEVWFAWIDGAVVMTVSTDGWKSRAVARGLDRARIWVGDYGRRKGLNSLSTAFRKAPHFDARAERLWDPALLEALLERYGTKYPEEIGSWRDRMRRGNADRSRVLMRYTPIAPEASRRM